MQIFADVLMCLSRDPLAGNVSPALIGTSGVVPLSIVSTIPDIMRHYYDCSEFALSRWSGLRLMCAWNSCAGGEGGLSRDK